MAGIAAFTGPCTGPDRGAFGVPRDRHRARGCAVCAMISRRPAGAGPRGPGTRTGPGRPARAAGVPGRAGQARCGCRSPPVRCRVASMPTISPIRCTMIRRRSQIPPSASRRCLPRGGAGSGGVGSGAEATMALARSRPDGCRYGLRGLLSGKPLRTVTTAPSRGAKYPPFGAVWSSCDLSAKAAQMRSFWCATESGECAPGRKIVRPVTGWVGLAA